MGRHSTPDPEDSTNRPTPRGDQPGYPAGYPERPAPPPYGAGPGRRRDDRTPDYADDRGDRYAGGYPYDEPADDYDADDADYPAGYDDYDYDDRPTTVQPAVTDYPGFAAFEEPAYDDPAPLIAEPPTTSFATTPPRAPRPSSGPAHGGAWEGGDWTGSHRAITTGRRGVSKSVIAALVAVVVVVGAVILWRFMGDALSNRSSIAAARCVSGDVAVAVIADPSIADDIRSLAEEYNKTAAPVGDRCVKVNVTGADSDRVISGFVGQWSGELGERPALWIPGSSVSAARLETATGPETISVSRSLVTSPVLLAMRPELKRALAQRNWSALPDLQRNPTGLDPVGLPGWGNLRLALPLEGDADATYVATEAVAVTSAPPGAPATAGAGAVTTLVAGQPKLADAKSTTAMDALLADGPPGAAPVHAVVATEQQIYRTAASLPDAKDKLAVWQPAGPTAVADFPAVQLAGEPLTREQTTAASEFDRFLRKPESLAKLVEAGFRADGTDAKAPANDVVEFGNLGTPLTAPENGVRATLADAVSAPAQSRTVTIMLDQSMNTDEGGKSRMANVTAALRERLQTMPPTAAVGLWTFDGVAGRAEVATGPLGDSVDGQPRSAVLTENLDGQVASGGGAVSFTTMRLLYTEAVANFREGQENSVLVITSGPHTDQSLDGSGLEEFVRQNFAPGRPVAVNVIDFGADPDRATWEALSEITGGSYENLASSTGPELATAIDTVLS